MKKQESGNVSVYAITLKWPKGPQFQLGAPQPSPQTKVTLLGYPQPITWSWAQLAGLQINVPVIPFDEMPCQWAWVFRLDNLANAF